MLTPERIVSPDLHCLHPAPLSGLIFSRVMPHLATGRRVIAPDRPGFSASDRFLANATIADYSQAVHAVIREVSTGAVDLMGFHAGRLVPAQISVTTPERVR